MRSIRQRNIGTAAILEEMEGHYLRMQIAKKKAIRIMLFVFFSFATLSLFYDSLRQLLGLSLQDRLYSHIPLIPVISGYFLYIKRRKIFSEIYYSYGLGSLIVIIGSLLYLIGKTEGVKLNGNDYLSLMVFSALTLLMGGFLFCYGLRAFRSGLFPFLFLLFMVPVPTFLIERMILFLQIGSTEAADIFFSLSGAPFLREGFVFDLGGLSMEVAKQCSGIRSSIALLILGIVASAVFLKTYSRRFILILTIFPISMIKNGLRIVILSLLGLRVDASILTGSLHERGGIPFFLMALIPFGVILWLLEKSEKNER